MENKWFNQQFDGQKCTCLSQPCIPQPFCLSFRFYFRLCTLDYCTCSLSRLRSRTLGETTRHDMKEFSFSYRKEAYFILEINCYTLDSCVIYFRYVKRYASGKTIIPILYVQKCTTVTRRRILLNISRHILSTNKIRFNVALAN